MSSPNYARLAGLANTLGLPRRFQDLLLEAAFHQTAGIEPDAVLVDQIRSMSIEFKFALS